MSIYYIVWMSVYFILGMIMIGIGISQLRSQKPGGFYSGEKPPEKDELLNVASWNKRHGMMWIAYGIII